MVNFVANLEIEKRWYDVYKDYDLVQYNDKTYGYVKHNTNDVTTGRFTEKEIRKYFDTHEKTIKILNNSTNPDWELGQIKNNDGREYCYKCGSKTKEVLILLRKYNICTNYGCKWYDN